MYPPINMFWFGDRLPALHRMCVASFVQQGHGVDLYCYGHVNGVPDGVRVCDAGEVVSESSVFTSTGGSYALFADHFRYELLHRLGGWWADCDVYCLRPFDFNSEYVFGFEIQNRINNAVIKAPAQSVLTQRLVEGGRHLSKHRRWCKGAWVFHDAVMDLGLDGFAVPKDVFYPVAATEWQSVFTRGRPLKLSQQPPHALHLWGEMIRRHRPSLQDGPFDRDSLAADLWQRVYGTFDDEKDDECNSCSTC